MPRLANAEQYRRADANALLRRVGEAVTEEVDKSLLFNPSDMEQIPHFNRSEIKTGRVVGRGGFGVIREITSISLSGPSEDGEGAEKGRNGSKMGPPTASSTNAKSNRSSRSFFRSGSSSVSRSIVNANEGDLTTREQLARRIWSRKAGKFVVKEVEKELFHHDRVTFLKGLIDLAIEARFLATLNHPHALSLRGISIQEPSKDMSYFIILDQLEETLPKRLNAWMQQKRASQGVTGALTGGRKKSKHLLMDRLLVVYDVADVMNYLHSRNIIYRDLKPDNIGFTADSELKLFDFGLAKELHEKDKQEDGLYLLTGLTGAIRYMAPEVGLKQPYNLKVDVYSWSMMMWYVLALEPPFGLYTPNMFLDRVFVKQYRPAVKEKWPTEISSLMRECWDADIEKRPSFEDIMDRIKSYVSSLDTEVGSFLNTASQNGEQIES